MVGNKKKMGIILVAMIAVLATALTGMALTESDCRNCHGVNTATIHHYILVTGRINIITNAPYGCSDCHPIVPGYYPLIDRNCIDCHSASPFYANPNVNPGLAHPQVWPEIALASSVNPSVFGQSVIFTATAVAPGAGTPTGTVTFMDGGASIGTGTLSSGQATFTTSSLSAGSHSITAQYGGDNNFATSLSSALTQTVFDFSLAVSPQSQTIRPEGDAIILTDVTIVGGITQNVGLSVNVVNAATGQTESSIQSSISPSTVQPASSATVFVKTTSSTPAGTYTVMVTGTSGTLQRTAYGSVTVSGQPLTQNPVAKSSFTAQLVTTTPTTNQIQVPATGSFVIVLKGGSTDSVLDSYATDGDAVIQLDSTKVYKVYGRVTGGNTNAYINVFSPFISQVPQVLTPQPLTLSKTSPPTAIDLTSLSPYILQIPTPLTVDTSEAWVAAYYSSNSLPYDFSNNGAQETQLIFVAQ